MTPELYSGSSFTIIVTGESVENICPLGHLYRGFILGESTIFIPLRLPYLSIR